MSLRGSMLTSGDVVELEDIFVSREGALVRASGFPPHPERFLERGIDDRDS